MLTLHAGESSAVIAPETGCGLLGWTVAGIPMLRRALPEAIVQGNVRGLAGFPLLPFCNRIAYGRFAWDGQDYQLARNFGDHPHAIHGVGWQSAWVVRDIAAGSAELALTHRPDRHWPFAFAAVLRVRLTERELRVVMQLVNRHGGPAPAGLGLHPYFPRAVFHTLRFSATGVWTTGGASLPDRHIVVPAGWDHSAGRAIGSVALDHCFTGWDGRATLTGRDLALTLLATPNLPFVQVYTPEGQDYFCVEPVSHMPDAINRPGHPMRVLAPDESMEAEITLVV